MMLYQAFTKLELRISCNGLVGSNMLPATSSLVVAKLKNQSGKYIEIGRTEKIEGDSNPNFSQAIQVDYRFEEIQTLQLIVYDGDDVKACAAEDEEKLSKVVLTLGKIVASQEITEELSNQCLTASKPSQITVKANQLTNMNEIEFSIHGAGLDKKDFLGKSHPFLQICKKIGAKYITVHQTETIKDTKKPHWSPFSLPIQNLCDGDFSSLILLQVFDHDSSGSHSLIGECEVQLSNLLNASSAPVLDLINQKKKLKKKDYKNSGKLTVAECKCGIDFTGSNGDPRQSGSLHYTGSVNPNEYEQAIKTVGNIIQNYDSDQLYPAFGFGAKVPPSNDVSHDFPLNLDFENPSCSGIEGILTAYKTAVSRVKLWGPTNVAPIINRVADFAAKQTQAANNYFVLLLITDGVVTDMNATKEAIVKASLLPISVIVIGVGNADFTAMKFIDSDKTLLRAPNGQSAARDIVQFVPFRNFKMTSTSALASKVLSEIPKQMLEYFSSKTLPPASRDTEQNQSQTSL